MRLSVHVRSIHPRETTATWIISIFAAAKVSQRDYCGATRFHPREKRREKERRGEDRMRERRRRVVMRLRRLNITVNRARSNSDAGAGATRKHLSRWRDWGCKTRPIPRREKGRKEDRVGWINSKKRGISLAPLSLTLSLRGTERTKLSQDGSPRRLNPFRLIPDRRELTVATTIVFSKTCPRSNAVGCLIIYEFRKYPGKLY